MHGEPWAVLRTAGEGVGAWGPVKEPTAAVRASACSGDAARPQSRLPSGTAELQNERGPLGTGRWSLGTQWVVTLTWRAVNFKSHYAESSVWSMEALVP